MYNASQRILVARELARSGWNVPAAINALRKNYAAFDTISESTIRRMKRDQNFDILLQDQGNILFEAQKATRVETEMARERVEAQRGNPLRQRLADAVAELHEMARTDPNPKTYKVLLEYLELMRSMEVPQRGWRPIFTEEVKDPKTRLGVELEAGMEPEYRYDPHDWPRPRIAESKMPPEANETGTEGDYDPHTPQSQA